MIDDAYPLKTPRDRPRSPAPLRPAATLVIVRDNGARLEVLLLRRAEQLSAFGGVWVFPGGALEPEDGPVAGEGAFQQTARTAAARELREETGLHAAPEALVPFARWTAPVIMPRRFDTWFFLAEAPSAQVRVDGGEIHAFRWTSPGDALEAHRAGRLPLFPPTWITLHHLAAFRDAAAAIADAAARTPFHYAPKVVSAGPDKCFLYDGDQAYATLAIDAPGPRHRLWARESGWHYECTMDGRRSEPGRRPGETMR